VNDFVVVPQFIAIEKEAVTRDQQSVALGQIAFVECD